MHQRMTADGHFQHPALCDGIAKQHCGDADHCFDHPAENQAIHQAAQIQRTKTAQKSGWLAAVPQLHELYVRQDFRAAPITREEKHGHHPGKALRPPQPVPRDSILRDQPCDEQWRVRRKRGGHHRRARQPPRHISS